MYYLFNYFNGYGYNLIDVSDNLDYLLYKRRKLKKRNPNFNYCILRDIYWRCK